MLHLTRMRPAVLNPLFRPVTSLAGIGPKLGVVLAKLLGTGEDEPRVVDLLFHLPAALIDRSKQPGIAKASEGQIVTLKVRIDRHQPPPRGNKRIPWRVFAHDDTGEIALTFFHARGDYLEKTLPVGATRYVSGRMEWFNGRPAMVHPDHIVDEADFAELPLIEPVYPMTAGLSPKTLVRAMRQAVSDVPPLPEWLDGALVRQRQWPAFAEALAAAHRPETVADLDPASPVLSRLAYDEILASQLALALMREHQRRATGKARKGDGTLRRKLIAVLPFELTGSQRVALNDIESDLGRRERMLRLLQGDVGSGKTVVALLAAANVIEAGGQAAIMAPTELLVRQHERTIRPLAEAAGIRLAVLTGRDKGRERDETLAGLADGSIDLLIGTHALFQAGVAFRDLALVVVDEQHRFGVHQRARMRAKAEDATSTPHVLVMTATPIPRTLAITIFGDLDVSTIDALPPGRKPVKTALFGRAQRSLVYEQVKRRIDRGEQAFIVVPAIGDTSGEEPESGATTAHALTQELSLPESPLAGVTLATLHGRLPHAERERIMEAFRAGSIQALVATTVIEVGVDIPNATIIAIEDADRFGLAQLHQLRGRVGRGRKPSVCMLIADPVTPEGAERLKALTSTTDGFKLAETDFLLRGPGELFGARQSGSMPLKVADLTRDLDLLSLARHDAASWIKRSPTLSQPGEALLVRRLKLAFGDELGLADVG